jgi:hypothetical protein
MPDEPSQSAGDKARPVEIAAPRDGRREHRLMLSLLLLVGMERNVGAGDRALRVTLGALLFAMVFVGPTTPWGIVGIVPLLTGLTGSCPIYRALGVTTARPSIH